jgi:hypothetical protein
MPARRDARQADDAARADFLDRVEDERSDAGALENQVRPDVEVGDLPGVVRRTEIGDEAGLRPLLHAVEHVDVEPPLARQERG